MAEKILLNHFLKLSTILLSLLLSIFLTINLACAGNKTTDNVEKIRRHVKKVSHKDPETAGKLGQIEDKLNAGMSLKDACQQCHSKQKSKP